MNQDESLKRLQAIKHLYEVEQFTIKEIAKRLGVTRQAVHERMVRSGIARRDSNRPRRQIDPETLYRLYVTEGLPVYKVAKALRTVSLTVDRELKRYSIERRPKGFERRKLSALDNLKIGESALIKCPRLPKPHASIYSLAEVRKIKVSIRRIDADHVRVTRMA